MSGVCTHVSACTRTRLCGAQVPMVTVQQPGRARRCQSRGKGRPVPPHCQARCRLVPLQGVELERLSPTLKCPEAASRGWGRQAGAAWL